MQGFPFVGHIEELRKRVIRVLVVFFVALAGSIAFVQPIYRFLIRPVNGRLTVLGPGDVVQIYLMIAGVAALAVTTPFLLWQLWKFVEPGLLPRERRYAARLIGPVAVMFVAGICFSYFLIFPQIFHFLRVLAQPNFHFMITATEYFSFLFDIVLPFGFLFELPIVVLFLTHIGLISPALLRKNRRYAYFVCVLIGVFISPPELVSHLSVVVPMVLVYEISIGISALAYRKKLAEEAKWASQEESVSLEESASAEGPVSIGAPASLEGPVSLEEPVSLTEPAVGDQEVPEEMEAQAPWSGPMGGPPAGLPPAAGLRVFAQPPEPVLPPREGIRAQERE